MERADRFDWTQLVDIPNRDEKFQKGRQVLNFFPWDKDFRENREASAFVKTHFQHAKALDTDASILKYAQDQVTLEGMYLEMGVCTGRTINFIAALNPRKKIYGFDSFEGLPEEWTRQDVFIPKGTFQIRDKNWIPPVLHNVVLIKGLFKESLPKFKEQILKKQPVAFIHIDCDIYSSTKEVFEILDENVVSKTVILFDEYYNYPGFDQHEFKAFQEFLMHTGKKARYLAYNQYFEQVVCQIE